MCPLGVLVGFKFACLEVQYTGSPAPSGEDQRIQNPESNFKRFTSPRSGESSNAMGLPSIEEVMLEVLRVRSMVESRDCVGRTSDRLSWNASRLPRFSQFTTTHAYTHNYN